MSWQAVDAALKANLGSSTLKLVAIHFAERSNEKTKLCWSSLADGEERTELDRKTLIKKIQILVDAKILVDTGVRRGKTKQIIVWKMDIQCLAEYLPAEKMQRQPKKPKPLKSVDPNTSAVEKMLTDEEIEVFVMAGRKPTLYGCRNTRPLALHWTAPIGGAKTQ